MLFNSLIFPIFFIVVYALYCALQRSFKAQNALLLAASYFFYGWWDVRFLSLLALSTFVDFQVGRALQRTADARRRRALLLVSVATNLSVLGFFKYFDFFAESLAFFVSSVGLSVHPFTLQVILPVGISFYTFQTMSYTIDVYRGRIRPTDSILDFALFVAFFPQLVAGPIERAASLLPQMGRARKIDLERVNAGLFLILWGYFKKVLIADRAALVADPIFNGYAAYHGLDLWIGALAFTLQIYCDFSGYTDIARGTAKLMGFDLMVNFKLPYFARSPADFWNRWHISLSSWLRDYLYIPLGGNRAGPSRTYRNLFLTMLLGGLWHGAAWNFVLWGAFHGGLLVAWRYAEDRGLRDARALVPRTPAEYGVAGLQMALTFVLVVAGWVLFRCQSPAQILHFFVAGGLAASAQSLALAGKLALLAAPLVVVQVLQQHSRNLLVPLELPVAARAVLYVGAVLAMALFGVREPSEFIYFQF